MPRSADVWGRVFVAAPTAEQAAALDERARAGGVVEPVLMENAGRSAALVLQSIHPEGRVVAAIGSGHNGGDAIVLLRTLRAWGRDVAAHFLSDPAAHDPLLHDFDVPRLDDDAFAGALSGAGALVDGILGTGARGAPREGAARVIEAMNASGRPILAIDLPSGVDPDTGAVPGAAVRATVTVSFGGPKRGLLFQPARSHCGRLMAVEIGFPPIRDDEWDARLVTPSWARSALPRREPTAHKGSAGMVLVLAGSRGMGGAAVLCARAAIRAGAGLVYLASDDGNRAALHAAVPDAVFVDRDDDDAVVNVASKIDALVAGPGMGTDQRAAAALDRVLGALDAKVPALLDADALTLLGAQARLGEIAASRPVLVTPHPGEYARLTGSAVDDVRADPVGRARALASDLGCDVLLKGLPSVVAGSDGVTWINTAGSSDLAAAGMGDTLAGAIGALLATGMEPDGAAALGLFLSSRAADLIDLGRSLSPVDIADVLPRALAEPGSMAPPAGLPFVVFDQPERW